MTANLQMVYERLLSAYGPQGWWPADSHFEMMIGAVLTQSCAWTGASRAVAALTAAGIVDSAALLAMGEGEIAQLVRPAGYYNAKARKLRALAQFVQDRFEGDPSRMSDVPTGQLREMLLSVHGIGEETADDILVYAAGKAVFVVDAYTRRIASRLGLCRGDEAYAGISSLFAAAMPRDPAVLGEYHALLVRHAKQTCRKVPLCGECPVADLCPTGAGLLTGRTGEEARGDSGWGNAL